MINIDEQKIKLLEEKKSLEQDLTELGVMDSDGGWSVRPDSGDGTHADSIDNADITEDFEEKIARLDILEKRLNQVDAALVAIEKGSYGICTVSGKPIPEDRLHANPSATTIVEHSQ